MANDTLFYIQVDIAVCDERGTRVLCRQRIAGGELASLPEHELSSAIQALAFTLYSRAKSELDDLPADHS